VAISPCRMWRRQQSLQQPFIRLSTLNLASRMLDALSANHHARAFPWAVGRQKRLALRWRAEHVLPSSRSARFSSGLVRAGFHCEATGDFGADDTGCVRAIGPPPSVQNDWRIRKASRATRLSVTARCEIRTTDATAHVRLPMPIVEPRRPSSRGMDTKWRRPPCPGSRHIALDDAKSLPPAHARDRTRAQGRDV